MNESDDENAVLPSSSGALLSGNSLLQLHVTAGKNLPKDGSKDFCPSNSWMEKKQIQSALDERHQLLNEERVEKWGCLAGAIWDKKKKLAEVTRRTGKIFQTLGFEKNGILYLYPEEALHLLEVNSLELTFGGVPVSLQQGYALLLGTNTGCSLIEYRVYSNLLRQGYKLLRFTSQKAYTKYERAIRLDQHMAVKRSHPGERTLSSPKPSHALSNFQLKDEDGSSRTVSPSRKNNSTSMKEENDPSISRVIKNVCETEFTLSSTSGSSGTSISTNDHCRESVEMVSQNMKSTFCPEQLTKDSAQPSKPREGPVNSSGESKVVSELLDEQSEHHQQIPDNIRIQSTEKSRVCQGFDSRTEALAHLTVSEDSFNQPQNQQLQDMSEGGSTFHSIQESAQSSSMEGVKNKAYGIAKRLVSLGNVLVEKSSSDQGEGENMSESEALADSLQSEIIRELGSQLDTGLSEESLATVAASAASTILSHISSDKEKGNQNTECDPNDEETMSTDKSMQVLDSTHESNDNILDQSMVSESDLGTVGLQSTKLAGDIILDSNDNNDNGSHTSTSLNDDYDMEKDEITQPLKRQAPSCTEVNECEPVVIKKAKVAQTCESEIEILDFVPEEKQVELVNLSDESSVDSSESSEQIAAENSSIEVIDVLSDSSSSDSPESDTSSSSSESDGIAILEEKNDNNWGEERRRILETIPNMYNLVEISVVPPSSDLLPSNVQPQHSKYIINRFKIVKEGKGIVSNNLRPPNHQLMSPQPGFELGPQEPNPSINPMAVQAVQAIAQLVLPMLGLPSNAFPPEQMWTPANNAWFQPRSSWGSGPRFNHHSRRMNWQRSRPRQHGYRQFSPRYHHPRRGSNHATNFPPRRPMWNSSTGVLGPAKEYSHRNEFVPLPSTSHEIPKACGVEESGHWREWKQTNMPNKRGKKKGNKNPRYYKPPRKWSHMQALLEDNKKSVVIKPDYPSTGENKHTSSDNSESESSDEDSKSGISPFHADASSAESESTSGSGDSPMEVKPLLSPHDCTNFGSVFKAVHVVKEADAKTLISNVYEHRLKPQYDLFSPTKPFRKGNPPVPDFHLCILKCDDEVPTPGETQLLLDIFDDSVPLLFAIVSPDSVSFIQFNSVNLPIAFQAP